VTREEVQRFLATIGAGYTRELREREDAAELIGMFGPWLPVGVHRPDHELIAATLDPPTMPFVLVPDREAQLKRRIEDDEASERIASGALHLARLHTATIDGGRAARLYVNVDSPAVAAVRRASTSRRR
jgi:molecular chaperone HtpG